MKTLITLSGLAAAGLTLAPAALPTRSSAGDGGSCSSAKATVAWSGQKNVVETALAAGEFGTLAAALKAAGLVDALQGDGPFTVFAPTDAAFAALPEGTLESLLLPENRDRLATILTYHVVPGRVAAADVVELDHAVALNGQRIPIEVSDSGVQVAGAPVSRTDIGCSNGIIHVVGAVMMPATRDVVGTAVAAGSFETLVAAVKAGGLVEALQGEGPFTVFAPTDAAFAALPEGTVESLLLPEDRAKLAAVLKHHVVPGRVYADQLENGSVKTLGGTSLEIALRDGAAFVDGARVATADVETTNGVIHVIEKVLLP